ncbi:MAG: hypothetical protein U0Q22_09665 [Acidimicrobiales bacterium]
MRARRRAERLDARLQHRSVPAFMEHVVGASPTTAASSRTRPSPPPTGRVDRARRIVEVSTYPLFPRQSGGQLRGRHLAEAWRTTARR